METKKLNEKQTAFLDVLKDYPDGVTLFELKLKGLEFASGSINPLAKKGLVEILDEKTFDCEIVYNGVVVGHTTKKGKPFRLVATQSDTPTA